MLPPKLNAAVTDALKLKGLPHSELDVWNVFYDNVVYLIALKSAQYICEDQIKWINKLGGEDSRMRGVPLLKRIIKRLKETYGQKTSSL